MSRASIVILAWNGRQYLEDCLSTALAQDHPDYEVIVVDNASTDGSADFVAERYPRVRLVRNSANLGFARGMNVGIQAATGTTIALLNQDATVVPGWLTALDRSLADATVGIVGSKVLYPDRATIQHAGGIIRFPTALADHIGYRQFDRPELNQPADVDYVTGAAFAMRRDVLSAIGPFDEGFYPAYYEEVDLCWRARSAGFRVRYVPDAIAYHRESASVRRDSEQYYRYFHTGRLRFVLKHWTLEQVREAFVQAEVTRLRTDLCAEERRALHFAYLHARQMLDDVLAYRRQSPQSADLHSVEKDDLDRVLSQLIDAAAAAQLPDPSKDPLAEYHQRMVAHARIAEPTFRSAAPIAGPALVALRRVWNWMSTKWYVRPILQEQNGFNDAALRAVAELSERMGHAQTELRNAAARLNAAEHALLDTHTRAVRAEERLSQALDQLAELEDTAAALDRHVAGLTRDLARLALRVRRLERPSEIEAAQRLLDDAGETPSALITPAPTETGSTAQSTDGDRSKAGG